VLLSTEPVEVPKCFTTFQSFYLLYQLLSISNCRKVDHVNIAPCSLSRKLVGREWPSQSVGRGVTDPK
jgi:hypothetical protein